MNPKSSSAKNKGSKILILTSEFPPQPGGIGNHAYNLAKGLQTNGYEVKVMCDIRSGGGSEEERFDKKLTFEVVRIPRHKVMLVSYLKRIKTAFLLTSENDIIICSGKFPLWLGGFISIFFKRKFIVVIHANEVILPNKVLRKLTDISLKRFDEIIAVSNYTKSLVAHLNLQNVEVIHNGFEMEGSLKPLVKDEPVPVLITVGNVTKRKGQHNVINALPVLLKKYPDLKYHIVGILSEKNKLEKLALHLGVEESVVFKGKVSEEEKIQLLQQADVFIMLSETTIKGDAEGFGIAILEANALGVPAIGALGCGIEDAIKDGVSGRLISNKDPQQVKIVLTEILLNYQAYSEGAKIWSESFTWDKVIKNYLEILK